MITTERLKELLSYDQNSGVFTRLRNIGGKTSGGVVGSIDKDGYRVICVDYVQYKAHRLAWFYVHGEWPKDQIDHIDSNKDNNAISNLREATRSQNCANRPAQANNKLGIKGVYWDDKRKTWNVDIRKNGRTIHVGSYKCMGEAVKAHKAASEKFFGEFAYRDPAEKALMDYPEAMRG